MSSLYGRFILPKILNSVMGEAAFEKLRPGVVEKATGTVLELGAGAGHNFAHYSNIAKLYALEPSLELTKIAKEKTAALPFAVEFLTVGAENIPLPDKSVDTIVSTWTLCSVSDPQKVLSEVARVLKPNGTFVFIEHGASPHRALRIMQSGLTFFTKHVTGNCHMDRDMETLIRSAGFKLGSVEHVSERFKPLMYNSAGVGLL